MRNWLVLAWLDIWRWALILLCFPLSKRQHNKSRSPLQYITWQLFCSTTKHAELNSVSSRIWKCLFPTSPTDIQKNVAGQSAPAKFNSPQWALILFESRPTLKKQSCQKDSMMGIEDKKLDSLSSSVNSHYEQSSCFQQKFVVWALNTCWVHFTFPTLAYLCCSHLVPLVSPKRLAAVPQREVKEQLSAPCGWLVSGELYVGDELWQGRRITVLWPDKCNEEEPKPASHVNKNKANSQWRQNGV